MSRIRDEKKLAPAATAFVEIHGVWSTYLSNVYGWAASAEADAVSVTFKCRGEGDWIGICKRLGDDGGPEVVFGTAFDFISCVLAVNAAMQANRWKVDRPWTPEDNQ